MITKNGGCPHMNCYNCKYDFCWLCLTNFYKHSGDAIDRHFCPIRFLVIKITWLSLLVFFNYKIIQVWEPLRIIEEAFFYYLLALISFDYLILSIFLTFYLIKEYWSYRTYNNNPDSFEFFLFCFTAFLNTGL